MPHTSNVFLASLAGAVAKVVGIRVTRSPSA
jgi:hypothetical protein